ncbi:MAG: Cys-tRNA(Pro) deacylase [Clostridia bacterium]|nr:Cys-tRNA(Pro) deacylase [Clostridia bacterium]
MAKETVTNAMRLLKKEGIVFDVVRYESSGTAGEHFGEKIAEKTGIPPEKSFKTLVAHGKNDYYVACVPVNREMNLKKLASLAGEKKIELVGVRDLLKVAGYERGSVSPLGMKKKYRTFIDKSALNFDKIAVSGGQMGITLVLSPTELIKIVNAEAEDITGEA